MICIDQKKRLLPFKQVKMEFINRKNEYYERTIGWLDNPVLWSPTKTLSPHKYGNCKDASVENCRFISWYQFRLVESFAILITMRPVKEV